MHHGFGCSNALLLPPLPTSQIIPRIGAGAGGLGGSDEERAAVLAGIKTAADGLAIEHGLEVRALLSCLYPLKLCMELMAGRLAHELMEEEVSPPAGASCLLSALCCRSWPGRDAPSSTPGCPSGAPVAGGSAEVVKLTVSATSPPLPMLAGSTCPPSPPPSTPSCPCCSSPSPSLPGGRPKCTAGSCNAHS